MWSYFHQPFSPCLTHTSSLYYFFDSITHMLFRNTVNILKCPPKNFIQTKSSFKFLGRDFLRTPLHSHVSTRRDQNADLNSFKIIVYSIHTTLSIVIATSMLSAGHLILYTITGIPLFCQYYLTYLSLIVSCTKSPPKSFSSLYKQFSIYSNTCSRCRHSSF